MAGRGAWQTDQVFVTVGPVAYYASVRSDFLQYFEGVETYCVSVEYYHINKSQCHIHAYLKFYDLIDFDYVRECLSWFEGVVNIQRARSRRNVLKYVSKEDREVYFNCRVSELSFSYRAYVWSRNTPTFRFSDSFVLEHPQYYRLCWNIRNTTGCYGNCLVRHIVDYLVENQLRRLFRSFFQDGGLKCSCRYTSSYGLVREGPCIYMGYLAWVRHSLLGERWRHWDYPEFTCRCQGPSFLVTSRLYSPDLAPSDFHLFQELKAWLGGQRFAANDELQDAVKMYLSSLAANFFAEGIEKLVSRYDKCLNCFGDYVEK